MPTFLSGLSAHNLHKNNDYIDSEIKILTNTTPIMSLFCSLSQPGYESQLACLQALKLPYLYSTLELFVHWIQDGIYDFHHLPLVMKKHLEDRDIEKLQEVIGKYDGK